MNRSLPGQILLPPAVLILAFALRLYQLDFQSIWWDEGHSIFVAQHPLVQIPTLPAMDVHPPAYFVLLHSWLALAGPSEFVLRYLSTLFSLLTVALLWQFGSGLARSHGQHGSYTGPVAGLLAALSPLYVAYAQEVRSYAMITCLALAGTFVLWRLLLAGRAGDTGKKRGALLLVYIGLMAACLYTHYFTIFLLLFHNLVWLAWLLRGKIAHNYSARTMTVHAGLWVASQVGILLLFAPQAVLAFRQITDYANPNLLPPDLTHFISHSWQAYTVGLTIEAGLARWGVAAVAATLSVTWGLIVLFYPITNRDKARQLGRDFLFLIAWLLIPLAAYFVVLQQRPSFEPRYMMLVTPALFLLMGLGLSHLPAVTTIKSNRIKLATRTIQSAVSLLIIGPLLIGLHSYYTNPNFFKDDSTGVARWLARQTTPQDIVYVDVPHPFHYYADRAQIPAPTRYLFVDIHTAAETLSSEAAGRDRLFWVTWRGSDTDPRGVIPFLADKAGRPAGEQTFRGYHVAWYSLPGETTFSLPTELPPLNATFGDVLRLDGAAYSQTVDRGQSLWTTLHFTLLRDTAVDYRVSLRLRGPDEQLAGQLDRDLLNDRHFRTAAWPPADPALNQAVNVYLLQVAPETPPGSYRLEAVVYNAKPPYPSEGVAGIGTSDSVSAIIGRVTILEPTPEDYVEHSRN